MLINSINKSNQSADIKKDITVNLIYKDGRRSCMEAEIGRRKPAIANIMQWQIFCFYGMINKWSERDNMK